MSAAGCDLLVIDPGDRAATYGSLTAQDTTAFEPPLWCALLAGHARAAGYAVACLDADAEGLTPAAVAERAAACRPRCVLLVVMGPTPAASSTPKMPAAVATAAALRSARTGSRLLVCGLHPASLPEQTMRETGADVVITGEAFTPLIRLLRGEEPGTIPGVWHRHGAAPQPPAQAAAAEEALPSAAWDLLPQSLARSRAHNWQCLHAPEHRRGYAPLLTGFGCPHRCTYCPVHAWHRGRRVRFRPLHDILAELTLLVEQYGIRNIKIADELFTLDHDRVTGLCDAIRARGWKLNLWAYARAGTVTAPLLAAMRAAGFRWLCFGFESADAGIRRAAGKTFTDTTLARDSALVRDAGICILANFIFGLPGETAASMAATLSLAQQHCFEYANFYVAMPYPGSPLYARCQAAGTPLSADWRTYAQLGYNTQPLATGELSAAELLRYRDTAWQAYHAAPAYLDRISAQFGAAAAAQIETLTRQPLRRRLLEEGAA